MKRVVIVGAGFAGLNAAKRLRGCSDVRVTLVDRNNHHLFQPLLYQVAMAGLSPADIAAPIRSLLSHQENAVVMRAEARGIDLERRLVRTDAGDVEYDFLLLACGVRHAYFGHDEWEPFAPGLKTLEQATEIRRRVLSAFEEAEITSEADRRLACLTFVIVGGGPTGVELAGAIGEVSRFTLARDFRHIDPKLTRVILIEAGPRILPGFDERLARRATRDLESLGVQVWTNRAVTRIDAAGVEAGEERIRSATVLWAAGVRAARIAETLGTPLDAQGRAVVGEDLSLPGHPEVLVLGDLASPPLQDGKPLPGMAPVAIQQGRYAADTIRRELKGQPRRAFRYRDKGQAATIGRSRAIVDLGWMRFTGFFAWITWLVVHIYYLAGFRNRVFVVLQWAWSYVTFGRGARLIVEKDWRFYEESSEPRLSKEAGESRPTRSEP